METTQFWGTNEVCSIETAVDKALFELALPVEKFAHENIRRWRIGNVEVAAAFYSVEITNYIDTMLDGHGNYLLMITAIDRLQEYQGPLEKVYDRLREALPEPVNDVFTRMLPGSCFYRIN